MATFLSACVLAASGCSAPDATQRESAGAPDRATYAPVNALLVNRCGTLDCHGSPYRSYRIYGYRGLRLPPNRTSDKPDTTDEELDASYQAFLGLEPAVLRQVVEDRGARPERLTLVRKGRGDEGHKGGERIPAGSVGDLCIVTWLSGVPAAEMAPFAKRCADGIFTYR